MFERIREHLKAMAPDIDSALLPPASDAQIATLQSAVGPALPADLLALYRQSAGLDPEAMANFALGFSFMEIETVIAQVATESTDEAVVEARFADKGVSPVLTLGRARVAIGNDAAHCHLCIDLMPDTGGTVGQVICIDEEMEVALLLAPSLAAFLEQFGHDLAAGRYSLAQDALEDGVQWLQPAREIDVGSWYNSPTWSYVEHPQLRR